MDATYTSGSTMSERRSRYTRSQRYRSLCMLGKKLACKISAKSTVGTGWILFSVLETFPAAKNRVIRFIRTARTNRIVRTSSRDGCFAYKREDSASVTRIMRASRILAVKQMFSLAIFCSAPASPLLPVWPIVFKSRNKNIIIFHGYRIGQTTVDEAFYFMPLEKTQRAIKRRKGRKKKKCGASRGRTKCVHPILSINALHQTAGQFRASSRLPSSWYRGRIILASERKGLNDSRMISGDFRTFCLPFYCRARPSSAARRKDEERKKRVNDIRERGCAAWLVKEFSAGCGTRSFLGDDVLKFTVGVRSSLLLTGIPGSYKLHERFLLRSELSWTISKPRKRLGGLASEKQERIRCI